MIPREISYKERPRVLIISSLSGYAGTLPDCLSPSPRAKMIEHEGHNDRDSQNPRHRSGVDPLFEELHWSILSDDRSYYGLIAAGL